MIKDKGDAKKTNETPNNADPIKKTRTIYLILNKFFENKEDLFLKPNNASVPSRVVPMGQIYPQKALPIRGPDIRTMAAGIKDSKRIFALMAVIKTRPGSIWRKRSRQEIEIVEMEAKVIRPRNRTRQKI